MNCTEFQNQLEQCVENRTAPDAELQRHAQTCGNETCQAAWADHLLLEQALSQWAPGVARVNLADQVLAATSEPSRPAGSRASSRAWRRGAAVAIACSVMVCAAAAIALRGSLSNGPAQPVVAARPESTPVDGDPAEYQQLGTVYVGWLEEASSSVTGSISYVLTESTSAQSSGSGGRTGWLRDLGEQLKPLEEELDKTLKDLTGEKPVDQTGLPAASGTRHVTGV
ncbi:hypothetical protein [Planctomicrobium piriforme]|uniref:Uncharacterized protein n=1 Tax=Planctomicrobium piriforme TaxID=1576369 RepID=A0A1I3KZG0_9PLAN|nr:hypothetical protein [Planctomicrobium piriforme]SFI77863.1 hypothetical protein SAMN05421753_11291 [Planctomicrobium piriforme]